MTKRKTNRAAWRLAAILAVVVLCGLGALALRPIPRMFPPLCGETLIAENFDRFEWGAEHSTIIDPDDDKPGYVGTTVREWCIGPLVVTKVIYSRP